MAHSNVLSTDSLLHTDFKMHFVQNAVKDLVKYCLFKALWLSQL